MSTAWRQSMSNKLYGVYYKNYDAAAILAFVKAGKGTLSEYQRLHHPEYAPNSIYAWVTCQAAEYRTEIRKYRTGAKSAAQVNKFVEDQRRANLVHNQKMWRQALPNVVNLIPGSNNNKGGSSVI